jgi:hypothetical protein
VPVLSPRIVLSLCLLTASVSLAQPSEVAPLPEEQEAAPSDAPAEAPSEPEAPQGELIPYRYQPENEAPPDYVVPRIIAEAFGGVLGGVGMGIVGLLAGVSALEDVSCDSQQVCAATLIIITVPAVFVGIPLGVQYAAKDLGGRGEFLPSLAGTLLGTGVGALYGVSQDGNGAMAVGLIVGPVLGAIAGYEISHLLNVNRGYAMRTGSSSQPGLRVAPLIGATPRGGFLGGLAGTF